VARKVYVKELADKSIINILQPKCQNMWRMH
jgi:hypothetical protein